MTESFAAGYTFKSEALRLAHAEGRSFIEGVATTDEVLLHTWLWRAATATALDDVLRDDDPR